MSDEPHLTAALRRIEKLCRERPELQTLGQLNAKLLRALFTKSARPAIATEFESPEAAVCLSSGIPLWRATPPRIDAVTLRQRWVAVCEILTPSAAPETAQRWAAAAADGSLNPAEQLGAILSDGPDPFRDRLSRLKLDVPLGFTILRLSSLALLAPMARRWELHLRSTRWELGHCPICGCGPLLAELRGLEQLRWLRCGWCAAQWQVDRLYCPFCNHRDHQQLHDLFVAGQEQGPRLSVCAACGGSLPTLATLETLTTPGLLVAEMETLHLRFLNA